RLVAGRRGTAEVGRGERPAEPLGRAVGVALDDQDATSLHEGTPDRGGARRQSTRTMKASCSEITPARARAIALRVIEIIPSRSAVTWISVASAPGTISRRIAGVT